MAEHLYQQPTLIELLVGIAVEALATKHCRRLVVTGDATEEHLNLIEETLGGITLDWSSDLPKILECERLMTKNMLCSMIYEVNPKGKTRLSRDPAAMMRAQFPDKVPPPTYWQSKLTKAGIVLGWFFMPSTPQKAGEIIDASYEELYAMAESDFDWQKATEKPSRMLQFNYQYLVERLAGISEPAYHRIHDTYLRNTAEKRGSRLIIALRRYKNKHGHWPESLNGIESLAPAEIFVDPINDNSFVYKLTDENFTLYSKGKNTIDENGQYNSTWDPNSFEDRVEEDDILIWPRRSRKTKEGNADAE